MGQLGLQESKWVSQKKKSVKICQEVHRCDQILLHGPAAALCALRGSLSKPSFYPSFPFQNSKVDSAMNIV